MKIVTNNRARPLLSLVDLPKKAQADFEYLDTDEEFTPRFVKYRDAWYDVFDVQAIRVGADHDRPMGWALYVAPEDPLARWGSIISDSAFSGVLFRFPPDADGETVVCGSYYS